MHDDWENKKGMATERLWYRFGNKVAGFKWS